MALLTVELDCSELRGGDIRQIDALARFCRDLRRSHCELRLCRVSAELAELISFAGLADVLGVEPGRQAEEREDPRRVEEEGEL